MSDPQHSELEVKYAADSLTIAQFEDFLSGRADRFPLQRKIVVTGTDIYYERGRDVVRQRMGDGCNELTVKVRKSRKSIQDRHEVDLSFAEKTRPIDVQQFLKLTGWKESVSLVKTSYIYFFRRPANLYLRERPREEQYVDFDIAVYDVTLSPPGLHATRRFMEVEIHKDSPVDMDARVEELRLLKTSFPSALKLGEPLNESLYEIYSGKKYRIQKG